MEKENYVVARRGGRGEFGIEARGTLTAVQAYCQLRDWQSPFDGADLVIYELVEVKKEKGNG